MQGFGRSEAQRAVQAGKRQDQKNWLTKTGEDGKIDLDNFKAALKNGYVNTKIEQSQQQKHQSTKAWKNQVKQALNSGGKQTPKSVLLRSVNPQKIVDQYAGTGVFSASRNNSCVDEYVTLPYIVGKTFDKASGRYVNTHRIQIKYTKNGVHIFPVKERRDFEMGNEKN